MSGLILESTRRLSTKRSHGRVVNEIAAYFRKHLTVPHLFVKPRVPGVTGIDLLAVDHAGGGDVHAVEIKVMPIIPTRSGIREVLTPLRNLPVHYRYLAVQTDVSNKDKWLRLSDYDELFEPSGIGRYGVITFDERLLQVNAPHDPALLSVIIRPERFLVRGEKLAILENFLQEAEPDMQVRV